MGNIRYYYSIGLIALAAFFSNPGYTQVARLDSVLAARLENLSLTSTGIDQPVTLSVSGVSIQEFLRALAEAADLNVNVDPALQIPIVNNFTSETPRNILLFLAKEYQLDLAVIGSIISISKFDPTKTPPVAKVLKIQYDALKDHLSMDLEKDSLTQVAKAITRLSGKNVLVSKELAETQVRLFLKDMPFEHSLKQLAYSSQVKLSEAAGGAFLFLPLGAQEENFITADKEFGTRRTFTSPNLQDPAGATGGLHIDVIKHEGEHLLHIDAVNTPIEQLIKAVAQQIEVNYFMPKTLQGSATVRLRQVRFSNLLDVLLKGTEYTYKVEDGVYSIGSRSAEGLRSIKVVQLQHRSIDTIRSMIPMEWRKGVEIKEFREQNTLLLAGSLPQINEIADLIKQLDVLVPMILIEVNMLDIRKGHQVETGIKAGISDSIVTGGTLLSGLDFTFGAKSITKFLNRIGASGSFNLGKVSPNFYVQLSALEKNHNVEMRAVPKLSTLNGHVANLSIGNKRFYSISTQNVMGSLNPQTVVTQQFNEVEANMTINIVPIVSGDEQVTLNIVVDITDFTQDTPLDQPPPSTNSKFESIIRVRNEETVVLGGIERFESKDGGSGIPLLSRIPVLRWLFSSKSKSRSKVISVVFIKPTIFYQ